MPPDSAEESMKYSHVLLKFVALSIALFLIGCSSGPSQMFLLAQKARTEAAAENADQFASDLWISAEKYWQEGNAKLEAKKYGEADKIFLRAKTDFVKARDSARSKREELVKGINASLKYVEIHLKSKKEFDAKLKEIEDNRSKVAVHVKNGQFNEADQLARITMRTVYEVQQEYLKK
jgi:hypothetical protein